MATVEQFLTHLQAIAPTVRRGYTRDGRYVGGTYVWVQDAPPYNYRVHVEHCGISLGVAAHEVGLVKGRDFADSAYTPAGIQGFATMGRAHTTPQRGDWAFFDWGYAGMGAWGYTDHVGAVLDASTWARGWITTLEFNTTGNAPGAGYGIVYKRASNLFTGFGRPAYDTAPVPAPTVDVRRLAGFATSLGG